MATTTATLSIADFIAGKYSREWELVDGSLKERRVGGFDHGRLQMLLGGWFLQNESLWGAIVLAKMDTITTPTRFRKPDVAVARFGRTPDRLVAGEDVAILNIEILSPGDTFREMQEKCEEYRAMGTPGMWIIDPQSRTGQMWTGSSWMESSRLTVPGSPIYADLPQLFGRLDTSRTRLGM
jgi:Uma2 family endonuclease